MDSLRNYLGRMLRIFIFYIVLHTATSVLDRASDLENQEFTNYGRQSKETRYDQILSNLHSLFKDKRSSDTNDNSKSVDDYNDFNYKRNNEDKQHFDEVLAEVRSALTKINEELINFNNNGLLTVDVPVTKSEKRYKRDVANDTVANITSTENDTIDVTTTEQPEMVTEPVEVFAGKNESSVKSENLLPNAIINKTEVTPLNSRRMLSVMAPPPEYVTTNSRVKDKLLSYLEDTFAEVERKIKPLTNIKIALSNDDHYRIGYIIATIDTLEVNLKKLKNEMNLHQQFWDDEKILDLFDRIKATNTVATSLIESLKKYLPRN